jgi:hypothetical protein
MQCLRNHLNEDEVFRDAWELAAEEWADNLEAAVYARATEGVVEPIIGGKDKDTVVGYKTTYSDRLAELLLKGRKPEVYKDRVQTEHTGSGGVLVIPTQAITADEWEATQGEAARGTTRALPPPGTE